MRRWARRGALALAALVLLAAVPVGWIEGGCRSRREAIHPPLPLVIDPGYARRESDSYLSYPEWHIVYAYEDLAGVLRRGDESDYAYAGQIAGFWRSLCGLNRVVTARAGTGLDTKVMLYVIGWSFSAELGLKGAYENTVGRYFEWLRGPEETEEDGFIQRDMAAYAAFLRQTPWYQYPFRARLAAFWRETPLRGANMPRKIERRLELTLEYGIKAVYGWLIGHASAAALGAADLEIRSVVAGLDREDAAREPMIQVLRDLGGGRSLILTPRYQAYTDIVVALANRGRDMVEIAGNRRILVTALVPAGPLPALDGTRELFAVAIQSRPDRRRVGLDAQVDRLAVTIRALERAGATVEHLYDY
jgi:hypothetical protein